MSKCNALLFEVTRKEKIIKEKGYTMYDFPEVEAKLNGYLDEGWTITSFSVDQIAGGLAYTASIYVLLTR